MDFTIVKTTILALLKLWSNNSAPRSIVPTKGSIVEASLATIFFNPLALLLGAGRYNNSTFRWLYNCTGVTDIPETISDEKFIIFPYSYPVDILEDTESAIFHVSR